MTACAAAYRATCGLWKEQRTVQEKFNTKLTLSIISYRPCKSPDLRNTRAFLITNCGAMGNCGFSFIIESTISSNVCEPPCQ